jgi:beta-catenin-like protein 1
VALDEELKKLRVLAAAPEQYAVLIRHDSLRSLLGLLAHENTDIAIDVVVLLAELTDEDAVGEGAAEEAARQLVAAIVEAGGLELLLTNLQRCVPRRWRLLVGVGSDT